MSLNGALKRNDGRIEVRFDYDRTIIDKVKRIPGRVWISDRRVWDFPGDEGTIHDLYEIFGRSLEKLLKNRQ